MKGYYRQTVKLLLYLCATIGCAIPSACQKESKDSSTHPAQAVLPASTPSGNNDAGSDDSIVSFALCGDIMPGTDNRPEGDKAYLPNGNGETLWQHVTPLLQQADVAIGNLETCVLDSGGTAKTSKDPQMHYVFRTPQRYIKPLKSAGFDILCIANNHTNDFKGIGRHGTQKALEAAGIAFAGHLPAHVSTIVERKSKRIGVCAFATSPGTPDMRNLKHVRRIVAALRRQCDLLIVSFHGGGEGTKFRHVTDSAETFANERRGHVKAFAHACVEEGADLVFGHGPHVPRAIELYKGQLIAYSLGNFCTPYRVNLGGTGGTAPLLTVNLNGNGDFVSGKIYSFRQTRGTGPRSDNSYAAA